MNDLDGKTVTLALAPGGYVAIVDGAAVVGLRDSNAKRLADRCRGLGAEVVISPGDVCLKAESDRWD